MTNQERAAQDERIREMKRRGIPSHVRVEILKRERAEAGRTKERKPGRKTNQEAAASRNTEDKRTMNARTQAVPLKLMSQDSSTATADGPETPTAQTPVSRQDQRPVLPDVVDAVLAAPHFKVTVRTWRRWDSAGRIPLGFKIGGRKLWRAADLDLWSNWGFPKRDEFTARLRVEESGP